MSRVHVFREDALGQHDTVGLVEALARGELTPVEAVEAAIARIEAVNPALNAMAVRTYDTALRIARDPKPGFFSGVPTVVKDNVDIAGVPTQHGTDSYVARVPRRNGELARMLFATGLVSLGKSQLSEYGFSGSAEHPRLGAVRCPWDTDRVAGASSAGAGALVAAGALPLAHGNDGGGSIRIPASVNGLVGLKPTRGRIAQDLYYSLIPVQIVVQGVLTRTVRDTAAFYREAERVRPAAGMPPVGDVTRPGRRRLRIGMLTGALGHSAGPEVAELTHKTAGLLEELGHSVEECAPPVPPTFADDFVLYWSQLAATLVRLGRVQGRTWDVEKLDNLTRGLADHGRRNLAGLPATIGRLRQVPALAEQFMASYDVLLTPTVAHETPRVGHLDPTQPFDTVMSRLMDWVAFTPAANVSGQPAISLPLWTTASGLPQGMMFNARWGREATLLELAFELEEACPWSSIQA